MATQKFEAETQRTAKLVFRRTLAWMYLFIAVLMGTLAFFFLRPPAHWTGAVCAAISIAALVWTIVGLRFRLRTAPCPCCGGELSIERLDDGCRYLICKRCGQRCHLGLENSGPAS
jgi:hypothetical protein